MVNNPYNLNNNNDIYVDTTDQYNNKIFTNENVLKSTITEW